ncbi:TolC family protein [Sandaracinus amylolyticus]|nr:TolC family protein [Sandaracinus amylolyticus]
MRRPARLLALSAIATMLALPLAAVAQDAGSGEGASAEGATSETSGPPVYDLAKLLRAAERSYPGIRAAEARIRAARAQLDEAWVTPYFQSWVTAGFTLAPEARGSPILSPDAQVPLSNPWQPVLGFDFQGAIPLWTFGKLGAAREAARAGIRASESDRARVRAQLLYDVRRAYFALQLALDVQQMLREGMPALEEAIERTDDRIAEGDPEVDEMDRFRLAAALSEVRARQAQAAHLEASSRAALQILSGVRELRVPDCPIQVVDARLRPLTQYVSSAMSDRPEVRMLEAAQRAREASLDVARAGFWPDLALTYRFAISYAPGITDQTNPFIIDPANYMNIGAGIALRWSLDFWGNAYRVDRESALLDDVRMRFEEARRGMELEITDAYNTVVEARDRETAFDRGRRETRAWFITAAQAVELGTAETNDLVDAVRAYFTARYSHLQAIHDFNSALANLERVSAMPVTDRWEDACD